VAFEPGVETEAVMDGRNDDDEKIVA